MAEELIDIAQARERVLATARPLTPPERVPLEQALGRVLAEDVTSTQPLPPFDSSAMDGFAVIAGPPGQRTVIDESRAGRPATRALASGEAIRISTGARIPDGADAVVPVENVTEIDGGVEVPKTDAGAHVRLAGDDVKPGALLIRAGADLGPAELDVLASLGHAQLQCGVRPRVAVLVTGDELVEAGAELGPGQIRDSNAYALAAQAQRAGATVVLRQVVPDDLGATVAALAGALDAADMVCVSGGVSVGPHDHVKPALSKLDVQERFWGVRLKPGKPTWFGERGSALVFGLPGNPVSAMVTFHLFARPALRRLAGADPDDVRASAVLDEPVTRNPSRDEVLRCTIAARDDGWHVSPNREQGSHVLTSMLGAGAFALVTAGEGEVAAGDRVPVELLF